MLSQVRVVVVGQEIDVWVLGRTRVRLQVGKSHDLHALCILDLQDNIVSVEPASSGKALLLTTSTEVSIAPKTRGPPGSKLNGSVSSASTKTSSGKTRVNGAALEDTKFNSTVSEDDAEQRKKRTQILRHLPARVLPPFSPTCPALENGSVLALGFVSKHTLAIISGTDPSSEVIPKPWRAKVWRVASPVDPSGPPAGANASGPAMPRILQPTDPNAPKGPSSTTNVEKPPENEILVAWSPDVPVPGGHITLHGSVGGIEDWDLTKYAYHRYFFPTFLTYI